MTQQERMTLRELAHRYAEAAAQDVNAERIARIKRINGLQADRPPVWIDEIPWHEMNASGELTLVCTDPLAREMEWYFRSHLFRWTHFQADMVLEREYPVFKKWSESDIGVRIAEETRKTDEKNGIVSHQYFDQLDTEEKLQKLRTPDLTAYPEVDQEKLERVQSVLYGIMPAGLRAGYVYFHPWDDLAMLRGVEPILMDMVLRPEFLHETMKKMVEIGRSRMEQMEALGLISPDTPSLHCTPGYTDDLPSSDYPGGPYRLKDVWFRGTAQMFSSVSPDMHEEFELNYIKPLAERCGLTYYGCCEPLHDRIDRLRAIHNLRKVGVSPWASVEKSAEQIGGRYVLARKPNPALVADVLNEDAVRQEITETITAALAHRCPYEFVLKDISTVSGKPQNLTRWSQIVKETIDRYY